MADKSGHYCHTGNIAVATLKFRFWEKEEHLYGESVVVVVGRGGGGLLRCGTTWRPPPEPPHPKQVKHVEKASGKKQPRQRWCTKIKKASLCDSPLNTDAE